MQRLITELLHRWEGKPILVIGGGPSVLRDLPNLKETPACVISANEHGFKQKYFGVDLVTNVDKRHCMLKEPMEKILRPLGGIIVNRHSWADYRLPDWAMAGNTGMQAIALAAILGANPVIVTGMDLWNGGRVYFHDKGAKPLKFKPLKSALKRRSKERVGPLKVFCTGANIRPMSGALTEWFKQYDPAEVLKPARVIGYRERLLKETTEVLCEVEIPFRLTNDDYTRVGQKLALSQYEYEKIGCGLRKLVLTPTGEVS
jgi:hypothetical protein